MNSTRTNIGCAGSYEEDLWSVTHMNQGQSKLHVFVAFIEKKAFYVLLLVKMYQHWNSVSTYLSDIILLYIF